MKQYSKGPIGIFDSGYGGLTVFKEIATRLPDYDYIYLGDNARVPYGNRSFETVYQYTLECVEHLFSLGCSLVVLACNTASARALRTIQQNDLSLRGGMKRVLGVIRPTTEAVGELSETRHIGILATTGTVKSDSYPLEIAKFYPDIKVFQEACPMWVALVENNEHEGPGADYFVEKHIRNLMAKSGRIDTIILGCTHYPLLLPSIQRFVPKDVRLISQGPMVAEKLEDYLSRHPEIGGLCSEGGSRKFFTTESAEDFDKHAGTFFGEAVRSEHLTLRS